MRPTGRATADTWRIVGVYAVVGAVWILGSGLVVRHFTDQPFAALAAEWVKGLGFVAVTAAMLFVLVRQKIAQRDAAAAAAATASAITKQVIDAVPLAIVGLDGEQRIVSWNALAGRLFGVEAAHRGASLRSVRAGRLVPLADALPLAIAPSAGPVEIELLDPEQRVQRVIVRAAAAGALGTILVAEASDTRRGIGDHMRQLQKMEAVGRVAAGVAHDLNNILTAVLANAEFLLADAREAGAESAEAVEIRQAALRASSLTRRLLAFSRDRPISPVTIGLNAAIGELHELLERVIGPDARVRLQLDAAVGHVRMDPGELEQVLLNLVVNAREAMPTGGTITVSTTQVPAASAPHGIAVITVADTGMGMDTETLAHIFEPFFTTKLEGTGIGLATVYSIIVAAGGEVAVESALGVGTTFTVRLPMVAARTSGPQPVLSRAGATTAAPHVLVVEDEVPVRMVIVRVLERGGWRVTVAASAEEAGELLRVGGTIDVVLADLSLPGASGLAVLTEAKGRHPRAARVLMSGHTALGDEDLRGATFIGKPFAPVELLAVIRDAQARGANGNAHS